MISDIDRLLLEIAELEQYRQQLDDDGILDESDSADIDAKLVSLRRTLRELQTPALL